MTDRLTIVTSCTGYGQYLTEWAHSIAAQTSLPDAVCVFTHGTSSDRIAAERALQPLRTMGLSMGLSVEHEHLTERIDFGIARNRAVAMSRTEWVMHLDADDTLLPNAVTDFRTLMPGADVVAAGYILNIPGRFSLQRPRVYRNADGMAALQQAALCSGVSPFRRTLWERSPYRTDMLGAWDTALWLGFARLGARFRATKKATFVYRQHDDSIFNQRRRSNGWTRARTTAQLKSLRRGDAGVAILVPRDAKPVADRALVWARVEAHYRAQHPDWPILEGRCPTLVWSKGAAVANALSRTTADVLVIADADCLVEPSALSAAVTAVQEGAPWAMPHRLVHRANSDFTHVVCSDVGEMISGLFKTVLLPPPNQLARAPYEGAEGGGIVVMRRVWYDAIGGIPAAFRGWGSEDRAFACLANTLLGPCVRGDADLVHLYHISAMTVSQSASNLQLLRRLGYAAQQGKDALVVALSTLPAASVQPHPWQKETKSPVGLTRRTTSVTGLRERQEAILERRRRIP